jgi:hypothetical protein
VARYQMVVMSNPVDGQEADYNKWYDEQHLKDVLAVDGIVSAQRYKVADLRPADHSYMAVYEIDTEDLGATMGQLGSRAGTDAMPISPAFDAAGVKSAIYTEHGPRLEA